MVSFPSALEAVCRYRAGLVDHSGGFSGKPNVSQSIFYYTRNMLHSTSILFAFNQIICKFKLVQLHYHQTGCHNTALKMKTKFLVSKNLNVQRKRRNLQDQLFPIFSSLLLQPSRYSLQGWPAKKSLLQVQVVKRGKKLRQEGPGSCCCFINKVQGRG